MIEALVEQAAEAISPVWPLETFIACNPLQGLETLPFEEAIAHARDLFRSRDPQLASFTAVNQATIKWCASFLDNGQAAIAMPHRALGFYAAFRRLVVHDKTLHQGCQVKKQWLAQLPNTAVQAISDCLTQLKIDPCAQVAFIQQSLVQLPGWAGYIKWRTYWQDQATAASKVNPVHLVDLVAVRLVLQCLLGPKQLQDNTSIHHDVVADQKSIQQLIEREAQYKEQLVNDLLRREADLAQPAKVRAKVQMVFCIDVRSEPFRRSLESLGGYETFGFAGFFALPVRVHAYDAKLGMDCCPVLLKPAYDIHYLPVHETPAHIKRHQQGLSVLNGLLSTYKRLKYNIATPFALVETLGLWCGLVLLCRTVWPVLATAWIKYISSWIKSPVHTEPCLNEQSMPLGVQVQCAESMLRIMGLTRDFAEVVVLCGHGSSTQNNPYASGLDCGACGGNHGGANADIMVAILNSSEVRAQLAQRALLIPQDTLFVAAEHDTTTDKVSLRTSVELAWLKQDLALAAVNNASTRVQAFGPGIAANASQEVLRRASDWAEVRPEWGLARNAAFIVAPRALSQRLDLAGRSFLHSYDYSQDEDGTALETILTAPMVVAQWINSQYLFSTLDNIAFGSGSKITQNVVGHFGIMQGNGSDLMHGLPLQSVKSNDDSNYHEPQRLLTVVYAPHQRVHALVARHEVLQRLFSKGWVTLVVIEPLERRAYQLGRTGSWHVIAG